MVGRGQPLLEGVKLFLFFLLYILAFVHWPSFASFSIVPILSGGPTLIRVSSYTIFCFFMPFVFRFLPLYLSGYPIELPGMVMTPLPYQNDIDASFDRDGVQPTCKIFCSDSHSYFFTSLD